LEEFKTNLEFSNEAIKVAQQVQKVVERLAAFLKRKELKGVLKFFFRRGRLMLEFILFKCQIDLSYVVLTEEVSTQVIVLSSTTGGASGFTLAWLLAGSVFFVPVTIFSMIVLRSGRQQILNHMEYLKFKTMVNRMVNDGDLKETIQAFFLEDQGPVRSSSRLEIGPPDSNKNSLLKHDFSGKSSEEPDEFLKQSIKQEFGLIENSSQIQLEEIIQKKVSRKPKGKTVYFRDFIEKIPDPESNLPIVDAEILEEPIRVRPDNQR
jgi:hypothetical protein